MIAEPLAGPDVSATGGGVVSTVNALEALAVPCLTVNVWSPSGSDGAV